MRHIFLSKYNAYLFSIQFQRVYSSKGTTKLMMKYLFHLCCCTTDMELLYPTYNTLCYIAENNECHLNIFPELYLALANLGKQRFSVDRKQFHTYLHFVNRLTAASHFRIFCEKFVYLHMYTCYRILVNICTLHILIFYFLFILHNHKGFYILRNKFLQKFLHKHQLTYN